MLETVSLFDAMELDNTQHRIASRRALALAHNRVERNLGRFLRGAQNEDEFFERLGLVQDEFAGYISTASTEVGHEHPEHIAAALKDHYRLAVDKVEFEETPEEEQEEKDEEKVAATESISPKKAKKALKKMAKAGRTWKQAMPLEGEQGSPLVGQNSQGQYPIQPGDEAMHTCPKCGSMNHQSNPQTGDPQCLDCGYSGSPANPYGMEPSPGGLYPAEDAATVTEGGAFDRGFGHGAAKTADMYSGDHGDSTDKEVTCPECGGDGKTAGAKPCGKCKGKGKVPNFGDSILDAYFGKTAEENQNNTDLDGPEPKMDKRLWTPSAPGKPKYEDGPRHPTEDKDITEVIGPMRNDHELSEIHGQGTHFEEKTLPTQDGDKPFADNNMAQGPHTKTFNGDGQVDPVTNETLEQVHSAYLAATNKEAMGMSAQDFRMLADAIRTAPEGADKGTLANHVATYLHGTNPLFDSERFLQAAIGQPTSGRDVYHQPQDLNADLNGPGGFGEQLGQGLGMTGKADNPLSAFLQSEWPADQTVTAALLQ